MKPIITDDPWALVFVAAVFAAVLATMLVLKRFPRHRPPHG